MIKGSNEAKLANKLTFVLSGATKTKLVMNSKLYCGRLDRRMPNKIMSYF